MAASGWSPNSWAIWLAQPRVPSRRTVQLIACATASAAWASDRCSPDANSASHLASLTFSRAMTSLRAFPCQAIARLGGAQFSIIDTERARGYQIPAMPGCTPAANDSGPRGYALYRTKPGWDDDGLPFGGLSVGELIAADGAATAALWADLLTRDLIGEVVARQRPVDDPLLDIAPQPALLLRS
jgi:hypothetical protein